jgi:stage V sporulation protein AD
LIILGELLAASGVDASEKLSDCGLMIYDREAQDVHSGGSGCGCSAVVLASHILGRLKKGELSNILFYGTGAMMSPSSLKQGQPIPAVAHLLHLRSPKAGVN